MLNCGFRALQSLKLGFISADCDPSPVAFERITNKTAHQPLVTVPLPRAGRAAGPGSEVALGYSPQLDLFLLAQTSRTHYPSASLPSYPDFGGSHLEISQKSFPLIP